MKQYFHPTVLKKEAVDFLVTDFKGLYVDATCGGGGHTHEIVSRFPEARVICCDWDVNALKAAKIRLQEFEERIYFQHVSFSHLYRALEFHEVKQVSGILADFGTSRYQIEHADGFSFMYETPLDVRMSPGHFTITAADIIKKASEKELADIFYIYGEEPYSRKIARAIVQERSQREIKTTKQLALLVEGLLGRSGKIHPSTRVFQALRIVVNKELEQIENLLRQSKEFIKSSGRLVTISFHSLEDRIVKRFAQENKEIFTEVFRGILTPTEEEIKQNSASRSAKLRALGKR